MIKTKNSLSIKTVGLILGGFGIAIVVMLAVSLTMLSSQFSKVQKTTNEYVSLKLSAMEVQTASDYLTEQARSYVSTGDDEFIFNYMNESYTDKRREKSLEALENKLGKSEPLQDLEGAVQSSITLMNDEFYAMRLTIEAFDKDYTLAKYQSEPTMKKHSEEIIQYVMPVQLSAQDLSLTKEEQKQKALEFVYGEEYHSQKDDIGTKIQSSIGKIDFLLEKDVEKSSNQLRTILLIQQVFLIVLIIFSISAILFIRLGLIKPIDVAVKKILNREFLESRGLREYRYLVDAYNEARATSINNAEKLTYIAEHDRLTGLYNRVGYDEHYRNVSLEKTIYILIDIDNFKSINDKHGHIAGDKSLVRLSNILRRNFPKDYVSRLGGDEFAILITNYQKDIKQQLIERFNKVEKEAVTKERDIPSASFSIGVAFGNKGDDTDSLYRKADKAMYEVKGKTKNGYCFYEDIQERNALS